MAFFDNTLVLSTAQAITVSASSSSIYDITGAGSGNAPNQIIGNATVFGADLGIGGGVATPYLLMNVTAAFVSGGGGTLQVGVQAAIDSASSPGTYTTIVQTGLFTAAQLSAGQNLLIPLPPVTIGEALPRFYRVYYTVATAVFSAGKVTSVILLNPPAGKAGTLYPNNFDA